MEGTERLAGLTPWMHLKVRQILRAADRSGILVVRIASGRRSCAEQNAAYAQGRDDEGPIVTEVRGCGSWHVWGRAVDLVLDGPASAYEALGAEWERMGGIWGGRFSFGDLGHLEWHPDIPHISALCPDQSACPDPSTPWRDDRPLLERPGIQALGGVALAVGGFALARSLVTR